MNERQQSPQPPQKPLDEGALRIILSANNNITFPEGTPYSEIARTFLKVHHGYEIRGNESDEELKAIIEEKRAEEIEAGTDAEVIDQTERQIAQSREILLYRIERKNPDYPLTGQESIEELRAIVESLYKED